MPELPEAETIARALHERLAGATLGRVDVARNDVIHGDPRPLDEILPGRRVERAYRRAKRVILALSPSAELVFHLGMSGRLTVAAFDAPVETHTHVRIAVAAGWSGRRIDGGEELRFRDPRRFGGVWCFAGSEAPVGRRLGPLGAEPLELTAAAFRRLLAGRRQVKGLLLDQRVIAGIGNIYCDEALFAAGVHPLRLAAALDAREAGRLLRAIKTTLNKAIRHRGSTLMDYRQADGAEGSFQRLHRVYHREGKPCRKCGMPIERLIVAGRSTFVCTACQPSDGVV